jgi:uncharacterized glyoxalase superfamily protein PhnB
MDFLINELYTSKLSSNLPTYYACHQSISNFQGNTEEVFKFYQSVFGGEFIGGITRFGDTPEGDKLPKSERDKIMHIALPIGEKKYDYGNRCT